MKQKTIHLILILAIFTLFLTPVFVQEKDKDKGIYYTGIMLFLREKRDLTIVAPTLNDDLKEAGRISCERKKDFIEKYFKSNVTIIEDKNLTDDDKSQNLIIVGRDNSLLKEIWQWTPIRVTPDNFFFLSEEFVNPRDHATFVQVSPFDESKLILVSTSIEPDMDKIRPIPLIGSDWIVMQDLSTLKQGRFYAGTSLPPGADTYASYDNRENLDEFYNNLVHAESQFYEVFYSSDSSIKDKIKDGLKKRDAALSTILKEHGIKAPKKKLNIFVYKDKKEKQEISGVPDPIHFFGQKKEIHMIQDLLFVNTHHEDAHVVAELILSNDAAIHLTEGFAIYIDGKWKGEELDYVAGFFQKMDKIPPLTDLLDEGSFLKLPSDLTFPLIGSITKFIMDRYGTDKFKNLLKHKRLDDNILKKILGLDLKQFQRKWEEDIKRKTAVYAKKMSFTEHNVAAKKWTEKKDFELAAKELIKALEYIPDEPQALFNLASIYIRIPKLEEAEKVLLKLLSLKLPESESRFIVFGHYQLARVYDLKGEREKAKSEYKNVLALPDMRESHDLAEEGLARPASPEDLQQDQ